MAIARLARISYQAAVRTAASYGQALHVAFDLHRFDMIKALHYALPVNRAEELDLNRRLSEFFTTGIPIDANYTHHHEDGHGRLKESDRGADDSRTRWTPASSHVSAIRARLDRERRPGQLSEPGEVLDAIDRLNAQRVATMLALVLIATLTLYPFQFSHVRFLESYWDGTFVGQAQLLHADLEQRRHRRAAQHAIVRLHEQQRANVSRP